ncbi:glycoside hydrolase family 32 protein [Paraflavisolibacter sp. H34]|uniref:glycoside hydrolase family 32 protein n=1 Tax=Huijunlia imazamoxiresistens TaxID=3127457 RepID=UPI0030198CB7
MSVRKSFLSLCISAAALLGCSKNDAQPAEEPAASAGNTEVFPAPPSQWMSANGVPYYSAGWVGDVMPYFDNGKFHVFFLHDARDGKAGFHPIHKFETTDMVRYRYDGLMVDFSGKDDQDLAIGTGSVVKVGGTYYCYYTGHNYLFPGSGKPKEGVMYATSKDLKTWTKKTGFNLTAPTGYDRNEFRDPQVFFNTETKEYWMLVSTRAGGKAVVALFTSADPATDNWQLQAPLYTTDNDGYFMLECADVFQWGNQWYLFFSENNRERTTHYRVAPSSKGPWTRPANDVLDGEYFYAAKTASDGARRYAFGWTATKGNQSDNGNKEWAGNLVVHQLKQQPDGSLTVQAPAGVESLFKKEKPVTKVVSAGSVTQGSAGYSLQAGSHVLFDRISGQKMITATIGGIQAGSEFGLVFGAAATAGDAPYRIRISEADDRGSVVRLTAGSTVTESYVPVKIEPGKELQLKVVIGNSVCAVYLDDKTALSARIYSLPNNYWGLFSAKGNVEFKNLKLLHY